MSSRLNPKINRWVERSVYVSGDSEDIVLLKRIHWVCLHIALFLVFPLIPLSLILSIPIWTWMGITYVGFHVIQLIIFYKVRRGVEWFGLITQLFHVIFAFIGVLITGGILNSAGIVFVGLLGPLYALVFPNGNRAIMMLFFYLFTVITAAVLQPLLPHYPPITPVINIVMFVAQFTTVVVVNFFTLRYYAGQTIQMKILESSRLKELDEVKTKIYTNITHEFRTPLTIILGMADQLTTNPAKRLTEGLQMIKRNGENLLHLINQMLNLSKVEAKAMPVYYSKVEIIGYLRYILQSFSTLAEDKNIRLELITSLSQLVMDIDLDKIMQIVSNLLSNAFKFTPEGGNIQLFIDSQPGQADNELVITVKDNGIGIPAEKLPHIFNRFYKIENDTAKIGGTGIGLALTKELVALLKGTIEVQSELANGTEFRISLPITNQSEIAQYIDKDKLQSDISFFIPENMRLTANSGKTEKIPDNLPKLLIIEDNADVVKYLESFLNHDYHIGIAFNGQEGLEKAIEIMPDIIVSDVMMPIMNGFLFCEKLKTDERISHIPVILLTAMASEANKLEGLETGADAYLVKPFSAKELHVRIKKLIEQRRKLRERFSQDITLSPKEISVTSADERFLKRAMGIIENHLNDADFGVDIFGKEAGMSHSQLYRKIQALTNQTPVELIRSIRLKRAASLLRQKYGNISEIAYETGFNSPSYFTECFQRQFGISPSEFLAQKQYQ